MAVYDIDGTIISGGSSSNVGMFIPDVSPVSYDKACKGINHMGWTGSGAVANSLAAYKASKTNGFYYVETDVRFTSDDVAILYHDDYIDGTAVWNMTYAEVLAAVPSLAKFDDFIKLCRDICLHPYIEIKGTLTQEEINALVNIVWLHQMRNRVTWFGNYTSISRLQSYDQCARIGILAWTVTSTDVQNILALKLDTNDVFLDTYINNVTSEIITMVKNAGIPLEVWTFTGGSTTENEILNMDSYITGFTANDRIAGKVLYDNSIS